MAAHLNVLSLDPGGTTGIALRIEGSLSTCTAGKKEDVWEFIQPGIDVVVYERFASSKATSHDALYTIELVGAIQGICWKLGIPLVRHEPQNRYAYMDEATRLVHEMRVRAGQKKGALIVHEIDALAHLLAHEALGSRIVTRRWGSGISNA